MLSVNEIKLRRAMNPKQRERAERCTHCFDLDERHPCCYCRITWHGYQLLKKVQDNVSTVETR